MSKCSNCGTAVPFAPEHPVRFADVQCADCQRKSTEYWDKVEQFERQVHGTNKAMKNVTYAGETPEAAPEPEQSP